MAKKKVPAWNNAAITTVIGGVCAIVGGLAGAVLGAHITNQGVMRAAYFQVWQERIKNDPKLCNSGNLDADLAFLCEDLSALQPIGIIGVWSDINKDMIRVWGNTKALFAAYSNGRSIHGRYLSNSDLEIDSCCTGKISPDGNAIAFSNGTGWARKHLSIRQTIELISTSR